MTSLPSTKSFLEIIFCLYGKYIHKAVRLLEEIFYSGSAIYAKDIIIAKSIPIIC